MERPTLQWSAKTWPEGLGSPYSTARHCEACIFVYDVTNRASFDCLCPYYDNIFLERSLERPKHTAGWCHHDCPPRPPFRGLFFVIANKTDREKTEWAVSMEEGEAFCSSIGAIFMPMSAKTGEGSGSNAVLEMANHVLFQRVQNRPLFEGETTPDKREAQTPASRFSAFSKCWPISFRKQAKKKSQSENGRTLNEQESSAQTSRPRNPNELYWY